VNQTATFIAQQARGRALLFGLPVEDSLNQGIAETSENLTILQSELIRRPSQERLTGFGPLQSLLDDSTIEEVWINRPNEIRFAVGDKNHVINVDFEAQQIEAVVERLLRSSGRRIDRSSPFVDAGLADGSRLHVVIPTVTRADWSINIRKFRSGSADLAWLESVKMITPQQSTLLKSAVATGKNILVSGATQAGKTTLLTALINAADDGQRFVTIEDTFEISSGASDLVALQTREATPDGAQSIDMRRLVREALRMRPSRIVVGEVRGAEALDLLLALNSGIPGLSTIHANSAASALEKLSSLALLASSSLSAEFAKSLVQSAVDVVVHCQNDRQSHRKVAEILELHRD